MFFSDFGPSRIECDWKDINLVRDFFKERNPFKYGPELCNIANGVHAHATVNVQEAEEMGKKIVSGMVGKTVDEISFKRKDQAVPHASKSSVKIGKFFFRDQHQQGMDTLMMLLTMNCVSSHQLWLNPVTSSMNLKKQILLMQYGLG